MNEHYDVIVVGGGAAGCMAAGNAALLGAKVLLCEKNSFLGKKVTITGKGRCNVTNNCTPSEFLTNVRNGQKFLYSAINRFSPADTYEFFESLGVPLKTERGARVFPVSDKATDIAAALSRFVKESGAETVFSPVSDILYENGVVTGVKLHSKTVFAQRAIIATGGKSYPGTGSSGDGYRFAERLGHTIVPLRPALCPVESPDGFCRDLAGLSLRNVTASLRRIPDGKVVFSELGEALFTHFGISGPLILSASSHMTDAPENYELIFDLKPGLDGEKLNARVLRDFELFKNKDIRNALVKLLPKSIIPVVLEKARVDPDTKVNSLSRTSREAIIKTVKAFGVRISSFRPIEEAIVTAGGVSTDEVDPRTMASRLIKGLYFAGEVLNADAYTGGFNLQIAFSTGRAAGLAAGDFSKER